MLIQILLLLIALLFLPAYFVYELWKGRESSRFKWWIKALYSSAFLLYIFLAGRWDWLSYYLRFGWLALFVVVLLLSYRQVHMAPFFAADRRSEWRGASSYWFTLLVFLGFLILTIRGYFQAEEPVRLVFPLRDGWYYVGQGGNSPLLNYHNRNRAQRYALDIVALNRAGVRALGLYPADVSKYVIFGRNIYSPCDGTIREAVDGLPDLAPPETDREHPAGNHIVITCQGVNVLLAHLQAGRVAVRVGDEVTTGQLLGRVGNSGNTTEPHLHIHAADNSNENVLAGEGVPILFDEKFPVRNTLFVKR